MSNAETTVFYKHYDEVRRRWDQAFQNLAPYHDKCRKIYRQYASWTQRTKLQFKNNVDVPLAFRIIETLVPYTVAQMPDPGCTATEPDQEEAALSMNAQLKYYTHTSRNLYQTMMWFRSALMYSMGIAKDGWDFKTDLFKRWVDGPGELLLLASHVPELQMQVQTMDLQAIQMAADAGMIRGVEKTADWYVVYDVDIYDSPTFCVVHPCDFAWLGNGDNVQDFEACHHRRFMTKYELKRIMKKNPATATGNDKSEDYVNLQYVHDNSSECLTTIGELLNEIKLTSTQPDSIEVVEETRREHDGMIWITEIATSSGVVIRRRRCPYFHNKYNYSIIRTFPKNGEMIGIPILETCESLLAAVNKLANEILDTGSMAIQRPFIQRPGSKLREEKINLYAGKIIVGRPDDLKPMDVPDIRATSFQMLQMFIGFIANITGTPEILDSVQGPAQPNTAGGVEQLQNAQTARMKVSQYIDCIALSEMYERMAKNVKQYIRTPMHVPVVDKDGSTHYINITPDQVVGNYRFYTDIRTMQSSCNSVFRAQLQALLNIAVGLTESYKDPQTGQIVAKKIADVRALYKELLRQYSVDRPERFLIPPSDVRAYIPQQLAPPIETQPPMPQMPPGGPGALPPPPGMPPPPGGAPGIQTATGTTGMPPMRGGGQQPGVVSPQQVALPATAGDAIQSARSIQ